MNALNFYHSKAAHSFSSFAASQSVSFDQQPDPVRRFDGPEKTENASETYLSPELVPLPFADAKDAFFDVSDAAKLSIDAISALLFNSLALAGRRGGRDSAGYFVRTNPSSGNLHSEECYLALPQQIVPNATGSEWTCWHYRTDRHLLEARATFNGPEISEPSGFLIVFNHIPLRQSWKYGVRGLRYSLLDLGHAVSAVAHAANALGWEVTPLSNLDQRISGLFGELMIGREREEVGCAVWVETGAVKAVSGDRLAELLDNIGKADIALHGEPNKLAKTELKVYSELEAALDALKHLSSDTFDLLSKPVSTTLLPTIDRQSFRKLVRTRRSAQDFYSPNPPFPIDSTIFLEYLESLPSLARSFSREAAIPAAAILLNSPIEELPRGLYLVWLGEDPTGIQVLKESCAVNWDWKPVKGSERVFLLSEGWVERIGGAICCMQVGELSHFGDYLSTHLYDFDFDRQTLASKALFTIHLIHPLPFHTPESYLSIHLTASHIVHSTYLFAHSRGLGCSGMGCFIDLGIPSLLGLAKENTVSEKLWNFLRGSGQELRVVRERTGDEVEWSVAYTAGVGDPAYDERLSLDADSVYDDEKRLRATA